MGIAFLPRLCFFCFFWFSSSFFGFSQPCSRCTLPSPKTNKQSKIFPPKACESGIFHKLHLCCWPLAAHSRGSSHTILGHFLQIAIPETHGFMNPKFVTTGPHAVEYEILAANPGIKDNTFQEARFDFVWEGKVFQDSMVTISILQKNICN